MGAPLATSGPGWLVSEAVTVMRLPMETDEPNTTEAHISDKLNARI